MKSDGIILLNKRPGCTSFQEIQFLRKHLQLPKVGHAGTLDKFAEGLLIVLSGSYTKCSQIFLSLDKTYEAVFRFGEETDTLDPEGETVMQARLPAQEEAASVLPSFTGKIMQAPPAYSAVHVDGRRAYQAARKGQSPIMQKREVTVHALTLNSWDPPFGKFTVSCSKGTYIRSLARDIGRAAGSCAHVISLKRTSIGPFSLEDAVDAQSASTDDVSGGSERFSRIPGVQTAVLHDRHISQVLNGRIPDQGWISELGNEPVVVLFDSNNRLLGLYDYDGSILKTRYVNSQEANR